MFFDGMKTKEIEMTNPFDGTEFLLCYGLSDPDNFFTYLNHFWDIGERHELELK